MDGDAPIHCDGKRLFQRRERRLGVMRPAIRVAVAEHQVIVARPLHIGDRRVVIRGKAEPVIRIEELPVSAQGKVRRRELRDLVSRSP